MPDLHYTMPLRRMSCLPASKSWVS
jgi:hypothetical protein